MTDKELALRTALNVLRDSVEARRMPSGEPLEGPGLEMHEHAIGQLSELLRLAQVDLQEHPTGLADQLADWDRRARDAQSKAAQALLRLLVIAERHDSGQARRVASILAGTFNGAAHPLDLFDLRTLDVSLDDDAMACIDALRWGKADLYKLIPNGHDRILAALKLWGLE